MKCHTAERTPKVQNQALRIVLGVPRHTETAAVLIESAELPLDLIRDVKKLKYLARSSTSGENLPINLKITDDPTFEHSKSKTAKKPYSQKVRELINECNLYNLEIQPRHITHTEKLDIHNPDKYLAEVINKK